MEAVGFHEVCHGYYEAFCASGALEAEVSFDSSGFARFAR